MRKYVLTGSTALLVMILTGCDVIQSILPLTPAPSAQQTETGGQDMTPTADVGEPAAPAEAAESAVESEPDEPEQFVITIWTAESFDPSSEAPGGQVLLEQIAAFEDANPDVRVEVLVKRTRGPGGTLSYLETAPPVAPGILPDLVLLDREGLVQAAHDGLIVPLDEVADGELMSNLYPVGEALGRVDDQLYGISYLLSMNHAVYRDTFFESPPDTFEGILDTPVSFVFAAGTLSDVNPTILGQYLASGGTLADAETGEPLLDAEALREVLTFYDAAHEERIVDTVLFQYADPAEIWQQYLNRQANLAVVNSTLYLSGRDEARSTLFAWLPTGSGEPYALATGWSWAVVSTDPERQAVAMSLVAHLMSPANHGEYAHAVGWLPSGPAALAVWGDSDAYTRFCDSLLPYAVPFPDKAVRSTVGEAIQAALEDVLLRDALPIEAAGDAAQSVNPPESEAP